MDKRSTPWRSFFILYPLLALVPIGILSGYALWSMSARLNEVERSERFQVDLEREAVATGLQAVVTDLCVLAQQNELVPLLMDNTQEASLAMAAEYLVLSRNARRYDQIRYLDETGQEVVRVNNNAGAPLIVAKEDLQDKSDRYYFTESMAVNPGQIYVSPLDLNVEHGEIEEPYKPMIRLGTPVEDAAGRRRGVILINFMAQGMLDQVEAAGAVSLGQPMMFNNQGYWLVSPNPPPGWGFMFPDRTEDRMPTLYPEVWARMDQTSRGAIHSAQGLFTYEHYEPLDMLDGCFEGADGVAGAISNAGYPWVLASRVLPSVIAGWRREAISTALLIGLPILVLLAIVTRVMLLVTAERRRYHENLEALARVDALTGLANRTTFEERLAEEVERSQRHQRRFAVLFLDLDGFKTINDTQGHKAGDHVLIQVAQVLKASCRASDLAARQGGDEFVILLAEVADQAAAIQVAEKIRAQIESLPCEGMHVGASIGIVIWPDDSDDPTKLLHLADDAMYGAKTAGKNQIGLVRR